MSIAHDFKWGISMGQSIFKIILSMIFAFLCVLSITVSASINVHQLGARYSGDAESITFRIRSLRATHVQVWLYPAAINQQAALHRAMKNEGDGVWAITIPISELRAVGIGSAVYYGYRAWGENWPYQADWAPDSSVGFISDVDAQGNRFNPNKLLLDPYTLEVSHDPVTAAYPHNGTIYGSGQFDRSRDSGLLAPKGIVLGTLDGTTGNKPTRPLKDDVIYEVHLRGLTANDPSVPEEYRGTYRGAALKADYLASLGVTMVEFLPIQEGPNDQNEIDQQNQSTSNSNYWLYWNLNYFSPDRRYAHDKSPGGPTREFKAMVKAFHDRNIKVALDMVYNHTGEGGAWRQNDDSTYTILSYRGLDNAGYYELTGDKKSYVDNTETWANFNTYSPLAQDLIVDSLAYWRNELGVDSFRFDLASVLGNTCADSCFNFDKSDSATAINRITREFGVRPALGGQGTDWIAEPWAIGGNSYQLGGFPQAWAEWNGRFRDDIRKGQNRIIQEPIELNSIALRVLGSPDAYQSNGREPWHSINYIDVHDGFTLFDIYLCNQKDNSQAWPYGHSPGGSDFNLSWNQDGIAADQRKAARTAITLLNLSAGVPMYAGGDERLRTLHCNNNPYNLDTVANWLDWSADEDQQKFQQFMGDMAHFRAAHGALRPATWLSENDLDGNGFPQIQWLTPSAESASWDYMHDTSRQAVAWRLDGTELGDQASAIYVAYNLSDSTVDFSLPSPGLERVMNFEGW
ncbi:alpha-amylase family glycosyl hydrolase [Xanthomonas theicola]|nr:alpha-amylase family glycosyl hydrolase [Xanthomonas theicola]